MRSTITNDFHNAGWSQSVSPTVDVPACEAAGRRHVVLPAGPWVEASGVPVCDTATGVTTVTWTVTNPADATVTGVRLAVDVRPRRCRDRAWCFDDRYIDDGGAGSCGDDNQQLPQRRMVAVGVADGRRPGLSGGSTDDVVLAAGRAGGRGVGD